MTTFKILIGAALIYFWRRKERTFAAVEIRPAGAA